MLARSRNRIRLAAWARGRAAVMSRLLREQKPVRDFLIDLQRDPPVRVPGTAIFLDAKASGIPRALLNNIKFNRVIHEQVVLLTVVTREEPRVPEAKRLTVTAVCEGIVRVVAHFGFMEKPNILEILRSAEARGVRYEPERTTYFLSREELLPGQRSDLPPLRRRAFMLMMRGAQVIAVGRKRAKLEHTLHLGADRVVATEENLVTDGGVVAHGRSHIVWRGGGWRLLGPVGTVPRPGVVEGARS